MVRINIGKLLVIHEHHKIYSILPAVATFLGITSVLCIVMFLCGRGEKKGSKIRGGGDEINSKRVLLGRLRSCKSKMMQISWKKVQDHEEQYLCFDDDDDDEEAIWKKTIIKGEKCRPLNFSGKILYDSNGNRLPDSPTSLRSN